MKRCDPQAWAQCPDRMNCEFGALIVPGSDCDMFNEPFRHRPAKPCFVYDVDFCKGREALMQAVAHINSQGWEIAALSQSGDVYTVLFRRPAVA